MRIHLIQSLPAKPPMRRTPSREVCFAVAPEART